MIGIETIFQIIMNAIFQGIGAGIGVGIGTYMVQRSLIKHLEKFEKSLKRRRESHG